MQFCGYAVLQFKGRFVGIIVNQKKYIKCQNALSFRAFFLHIYINELFPGFNSATAELQNCRTAELFPTAEPQNFFFLIPKFLLYF
jgi:hypothetical protein